MFGMAAPDPHHSHTYPLVPLRPLPPAALIVTQSPPNTKNRTGTYTTSEFYQRFNPDLEST